jgi:hypothetical protein
MSRPDRPGGILQGLWRERPLSAGERVLAHDVFADALRLDPVRLVKAGLAPGHFAIATPFSRVVFCAGAPLPVDFADAGPGAQSWLIHELTHLWQAARGIALARSKIRALGRGAYRWRLEPGRRFLAYNIEQQAEMTAAAFLLRRGLSLHPDAPGLASAFQGCAQCGDAPAVFAHAALETHAVA